MICREKSIGWEEAELFHIFFVRYPAIFIFKSEYEFDSDCESEHEIVKLTVEIVAAGGRTMSAHMPCYENMAGNLNVDF